MENKTNTPKVTAREKYNKIVEDFIVKLENNDTEPWTKSWNITSGIPMNFESGNKYNGMNILTLLDKGYKDSRWLTFHQIKKLEGSVKKGEKSTPIFFMKPLEKEVLDKETGEVKLEKYFMMQSYNVFNIEQTENIEYQTQEVNNKIDDIQKFIDTIAIPEFRGEPAYSVKDDCIFMPHSHEFISSDEFYSTYFHELTHATGHSSRQDRFEKNTKFGDEKYAFEELIAELGSAFLSMEHGIKPSSKKQASYLKSWITALKERPQILYSASSYATKSTNYLNDMYLLNSATKLKEFDLDINIQQSKYMGQNQQATQEQKNTKTHSPIAS